ncbi:MAG: transposase [Candidatus Bathyarchaeia archaeon]
MGWTGDPSRERSVVSTTLREGAGDPSLLWGISGLCWLRCSGGITSYRALVERLENNLDLNRLCGFKDRRPPSRTGVSRFLRRLSEAELDRKLFSKALHQLQQSKPVHRGRPKKGNPPEEQ